MNVSKLNSRDTLYILIGLPWLFLMIMSSRMFSTQKIILVLMLFALTLLEVLFRHIRINKKIFVFVFTFVLYYFVSLAIGIANGYKFSPGTDYPLIQYYMFTPICVMLFNAAFGNTEDRRKFVWDILKWMTLLLSVFDVITILTYRQGISTPLSLFIMVASDVTDTELALRTSNETSFMFLLPLYLVLLLDGKEKDKKDSVVYAFIEAFGIVYALISGRKMLQLVLLLTAAVIGVWRLLAAKRHGIPLNKLLKRALLIILAIAVFALILSKVTTILNVGNIIQRAYDTLVNGLSSSAFGMTKRVSDAKALTELWLESPLWGNGLNAYASSNIANGATRWSYEVVYNALLAQTGIIGIGLLFLAVIYMVRILWIKFKTTGDSRYFAVLAGFASFIFCGSSNPLVYLIWPWAITLIFGVNGFYADSGIIHE